MFIIGLLLLILMILTTCSYYTMKRDNVYVSFTTTPDRIKSDKWMKLLEYTLSLPGNHVFILNVPYKSLKGVEYEIPQHVLDKQSDRFIINRCDDKGPITKILPTLELSNIEDDSTIIVIDDDQKYYKDIFVDLAKAVKDDPNSVTQMCNEVGISGHNGFAFKKRKMKDLIYAKIPDDCTMVDDEVLSFYVINSNLPKKNYLRPIIDNHTCSHHLEVDDGWSKLYADTDRQRLTKSCSYKLNKNKLK